MRVAWVAAVALLLAGCSNPPAAKDDTSDAPTGVAPTLAAQPVPLRFASGDSESITTYEATFQATDMCAPQCPANAIKDIDLTGVIPANAPVELAIAVQHDGSVSSQLQFQEAQPVRVTTEGQGGGGGGGGGGTDTQISAVIVRSDAGTVNLRLTHRFVNIGAGPGAANPVTANIEVRSVVRADNLVPGVPALVDLEPNAVLNFSNDDLESVVMFTAEGAALYDVDGPFTLTVPNATRAPVTIVAIGGETQVTGPNVTMQARRIVQTPGEPKVIASGADTTLTIEAAAAPMQVGVILSRKPTAEFVSAAPYLGPYTVTITSPNNVVVLDETPGCDVAGQVCGFPTPFSTGGSGGNPAFRAFGPSEHLVPGAYTIKINAQVANNWQATPFVQLIA